MCKHGVYAVNASCSSTMPWPWCEKRQVCGVPRVGVASNLAGRNRRFHLGSDSGKTSPLLRLESLDSVGEISSDSEQGVLDQNSAMDHMSHCQNMSNGYMSTVNMGSAEKYPYTHATDDQLPWLRFGNQFQQAYKMGFPYTQQYMMPQQQASYVMPTWEGVPMYSQPTVGANQGFGYFGNSMGYNTLQQQQQPMSLVYAVIGSGQPGVPSAYREGANQFPGGRVYPKSKMNPYAKPFTPQAMRNQVSSGVANQPTNHISERPETAEQNAGNSAGVTSDGDKQENGPLLKECVKKCSAVVSVPRQESPIVIKEDHDDDRDNDIAESCDYILQNNDDNSELTSSENDEKNDCHLNLNDRILPRTSDPALYCHDNSAVESQESVPNRTECSQETVEEESAKTDEIPVNSAPSTSGEFSAIVSISGAVNVSSKEEGQQEIQGRNMYILSRPRLKKKSKPQQAGKSSKKKKIIKKNGVDSTESNGTESKSSGQKAESKGCSTMTFFFGSSSEDELSDGDPGKINGSLLISPLQCESNSESDDDSDWDEVDGLASAADFLTDQMCELLQPFMLSVLTIPGATSVSSLPKSASAPHLNGHSLEAINRQWSEAYNSEEIKSVGAKHKKQVHFAQEEGSAHPLQTVHSIEEYCRRGPWERYAADRCRFRSRVADLQSVIEPVLREDHREKIFSGRFAEKSGNSS